LKTALHDHLLSLSALYFLKRTVSHVGGHELSQVLAVRGRERDFNRDGQVFYHCSGDDIGDDRPILIVDVDLKDVSHQIVCVGNLERIDAILGHLSYELLSKLNTRVDKVCV
jgi:hypothetical protein